MIRKCGFIQVESRSRSPYAGSPESGSIRWAGGATHHRQAIPLARSRKLRRQMKQAAECPDACGTRDMR